MAPPLFAKTRYGDWREEAEAIAQRLEQHEGDVVSRLLNPDAPVTEYAFIGPDGKLALISPRGEHVFVDKAEAQSYVNNGYRPEPPTAYWKRREQEKLQAGVEGAGLEAAGGGFLSGLSVGLWDMVPDADVPSLDAALGDDPLAKLPFSERTRLVRQHHSGKATAASVAGSAISLFYGGAESLAARGARWTAGKGSKVLGLTKRAERAAAAATREAQEAAGKDLASELALYKNLPKTDTELAALRATAAEARAAAVESAPWMQPGPAQLGPPTFHPMPPGAPPSPAPFQWPVRGRSVNAGGRSAVAGGRAEAAAERAVEQAAVRATEEALTPAVAQIDEPMANLWRAATGPMRKGRLTPKKAAKAVDDLGLSAEDARDLKELLESERLQQNVAAGMRDFLAGKDFSQGARDALQRKGLKSLALRQGVIMRRGERGLHAQGMHADHVFATFAGQARPALVAGKTAKASAAKATAEAPDILKGDDVIRGEGFTVTPGTPPTALVRTGPRDLATRAGRGPAAMQARPAAHLARSGAAAQAEIKAARDGLSDAIASRTLPSWLQGPPPARVAPELTAARGEAWMGGARAPKGSSRVTGDSWDPGRWSVPPPAPSFPGAARAAAPSTKGADIIERVAGTALRGGIEAGTYVGGRELSRQALSGEGYDPALVAHRALEGAAVGSLVSLAGAGLSSVAGRGARGLKRAVLSRSGVDTDRLEFLLARERLMRQRLPHLQSAPDRQAHVRAINSIKKQVFDERAKVFEAGGRLLRGMSGAMGVGSWVGSGSFVGMLVGSMGSNVAGRILSSGIVKRAGVGTGRALLATGRAAKAPAVAIGRGAAMAGAESLTEEEVDALQKQLEHTTSDEVGRAAAQGYRKAGLDPEMSKFLADYQSRRVDLIKLAVDNAGKSSTGRVVAGRVLRAAQDPPGITRRLSNGEVLTEDLLVLQNLFPDFYRDLSRQAQALLRRPGIPARQRLDLMKIAGNATYPMTTHAIQQALVPQEAEEQPGRRGGAGQITNDAATESQRIQGAG